MQKEVDELISNAIKGIKEIIDTNTIVGNPIKIANTIYIVPISKVSVGFVAGGGEITPKKARLHELPFAGASTSGFSLTPVGFISVVDNKLSYQDIVGDNVAKDVVNMTNKLVNKIVNGEQINEN